MDELLERIAHRISTTFSHLSSLVGDPTPAVTPPPAVAAGKTTRAAELPAAPAPSPSALSRVKAYAGEHVVDVSKITYVVRADGTFAVTAAPDDYKQAIGRVIASDGAYAAAWTSLAQKLFARAPRAAAAPRPTTAFAPASVPMDAGDLASGQARFHTGTPTLAGDTLDLAQTRAAKGDAGTHYVRSGLTDEQEKAYAKALASGSTDVDTFYCSGLSIWTLAAKGYDVTQTIVGDDGVPYTWTKVSTKKQKDGTVVEVEKEIEISFKKILDGEPASVEAMTIAQARGMKLGGSVGRLTGAGHVAGHAGDEDSLAVKGAGGAFVLARIGTEVDEIAQKPGDFAQTRKQSAIPAPEGEDIRSKDDKIVRHRGAGHAWQVWSVKVTGSAMFGQPGSPVAVRELAPGWHDGVDFVIDKTTDPALVGAHVTTSATRIEANTAGAGGLARKAKGGDGGVQITGDRPVPEPGEGEDFSVYYGRLGTSPWAAWTPAKKPTE